MPDKPSVTQSTLTMMAVWSLGCFTVAAFASGACFVMKLLDKDGVGLVMAPFGLILQSFSVAYLAVRKVNGEGRHEPTPTVVPPA